MSGASERERACIVDMKECVAVQAQVREPKHSTRPPPTRARVRTTHTDTEHAHTRTRTRAHANARTPSRR